MRRAATITRAVTDARTTLGPSRRAIGSEERARAGSPPPDGSDEPNRPGHGPIRGCSTNFAPSWRPPDRSDRSRSWSPTCAHRGVVPARSRPSPPGRFRPREGIRLTFVRATARRDRGVRDLATARAGADEAPGRQAGARADAWIGHRGLTASSASADPGRAVQRPQLCVRTVVRAPARPRDRTAMGSFPAPWRSSRWATPSARLARWASCCRSRRSSCSSGCRRARRATTAAGQRRSVIGAMLVSSRRRSSTPSATDPGDPGAARGRSAQGPSGAGSPGSARTAGKRECAARSVRGPARELAVQERGGELA